MVSKRLVLAGCTGDMMSEMQFRSWVAIVFGQATPEEQEQGAQSSTRVCGVHASVCICAYSIVVAVELLTQALGSCC